MYVPILPLRMIQGFWLQACATGLEKIGCSLIADNLSAELLPAIDACID